MQKEKVVRIEQVKSGNEVLYTKEIIEQSPEKSGRGLIWKLERKDFISLLIQALGLLTLLFAWFNYVSNEKDKDLAKASKAQQEYRDSLAALERRKEKLYKDYKDSLQLMFVNTLDRNEFFIKQQELFQKMKQDDYIREMERRNYEQRNNLFQKQILNSIFEADKNRQEDRKSFHAQTQLDLYMQAATILSDLRESLGVGALDEKSLVLLQVVMSKINLTNQDSMHILFSEFKSEYVTAYKAIRIKRSMNLVKKTVERLMLNCCNQTDSIIRMPEIRRDTMELKQVQADIHTIQQEFEPFINNIDYAPYFSPFIQYFPDTGNNLPTDHRKLMQLAFIIIPNGLVAKAEVLYNTHRENINGTRYGKKGKRFIVFRPVQKRLCSDLNQYRSKLLLAVTASAFDAEKIIDTSLSELESKTSLIHKRMYNSNLYLNKDSGNKKITLDN